ncbi:MAG: prephenate dehydratase domain-containing protein [bacterium]|nr:prephenate dehydratase domain-containing protein [bacterium]
MENDTSKETVAYQGVPGAYSSIAVREYFPGLSAEGFPTFDEVIGALKQGAVRYAMLPIENSTSGRVADIHHLLPKSGLHIIGEYFLPIRHALIGHTSATLESVRRVYSHREALSQCRTFIREHNLESVPFGDTAGAVKYVSEEKKADNAAIASREAADLYENTHVLSENIQTNDDNVTRFLVLQKEKPETIPENGSITSLVYGVRDIPAALYHSLGCFARADTNIIKLESFVPMTKHTDAHFYLEFEGNPEFSPCKEALSELLEYTKDLEVLGTYEKSPYRERF